MPAAYYTTLAQLTFMAFNLNLLTPNLSILALIGVNAVFEIKRTRVEIVVQFGTVGCTEISLHSSTSMSFWNDRLRVVVVIFIVF